MQDTLYTSVLIICIIEEKEEEEKL